MMWPSAGHQKAEASKQLRELNGLGLAVSEPRKGGTMFFRLAVVAPVSDIKEMGDASLTNEDKTDTRTARLEWFLPLLPCDTPSLMRTDGHAHRLDGARNAGTSPPRITSYRRQTRRCWPARTAC